jgi:PAS domain S-box-containing protein
MSQSPGGPQEAKILMVDDEPANLLALQTSLEGLDMSFVKAHSGEEALRLLLDEEFAAVLLDLQMPNLDGFETARLIRGRAESRHTPIIFQTAFDTDRATIEKAYSLGAVDLLVKPLMPVVLRAKVQGFVELFQHKEQNKRHAEQLRRAERQDFQQRLVEENARLQEERERLRVTLEALRESQGREKERADELEAILRATPTPIWIAHDPHCHRITGNPASLKLLGLPEGSNVSAAATPGHDPNKRGFQEYRGDNPIPVDELPMQTAVRGEAVSGTEVKLVFSDGRVRHIYGNAVPLRNSDGSVRGCVAAFADVTPLKEAEESLRHNQEIFKLVHSIGKIGHWEWNSLTDENKWSPEIEALYGLQPGIFEGTYEAWAKLLHPDDLPRQEEAVRSALETGRYFTEFRVIWPDGSVHWLETRANVFRDGHDKPVRMMGVNMDVTERRETEELLRQSEQRQRGELEAMSRLHALSTRLLHTTELSLALDDVLENAILTIGADFGNIQLFNPLAGALEIAAQRGFKQDFLDYFRTVRVEDGSACAQAMQIGARIIVEDVEIDPTFEPHRHVAAAAGFRAVQSTPIKSRGGSVLGMLSTHFHTPHRLSERDGQLLDLYARYAADMIERIRFEESIREHAQLLDLVHDAIIVRSMEGAISFWSPGAEELYGWSADEASGEVTHSLLKTEFPTPLQEINADLHRLGRWEGTLHHARKDGTQIVVASRWALRRAEQGRPALVLEINQNITERVQAEDRLRLLWEAASVLLTTDEPEAMLRELFARIAPHLGIDAFFNYMIDETGDALRLVSWLGIPDEIVKELTPLPFGQNINGIAALERRPIVATYIQQSDDPHAQRAKSLGLRAGVCEPLQINQELLGTMSFATRSKDEFTPDELDFLHTICQYVAVAYERLRLVKKLLEAHRRKDEFLATLAHELRNPLAPMRNAVELLKYSDEDATLKEQALSVIGRQFDQMVRLIDDLLDISRISQGKVRVCKERVELAAVVRSALETVRPLIDARSHELTVTLPPQAIYLDADPTRLAQVISNLLNNAAKYNENGGHIWLTAERQANEAVVSVRDTGIGIAPEHLPHIFEMFSQLAPALERSHGGLGIGLSLVRGLVELHGGTVEARSDGIGRGSEFIVRLPVVDLPVPHEPQEPPGEATVASSRKCRILVVDDNQDAAHSLALMLQVTGHETRTASDGLEATQAAAAFLPDVIVLDIGLPKMNGYEVARHIRRQPWGTSMALIALTGWGQEEDKRRAFEAGFDQHLTKPVQTVALEKLLALINPLP